MTKSKLRNRSKQLKQSIFQFLGGPVAPYCFRRWTFLLSLIKFFVQRDSGARVWNRFIKKSVSFFHLTFSSNRLNSISYRLIFLLFLSRSFSIFSSETLLRNFWKSAQCWKSTLKTVICRSKVRAESAVFWGYIRPTKNVLRPFASFCEPSPFFSLSHQNFWTIKV